jgi:hypothetical protein
LGTYIAHIFDDDKKHIHKVACQKTAMDIEFASKALRGLFLKPHSLTAPSNPEKHQTVPNVVGKLNS